MEERVTKQRTCPLCGKIIDYVYVSDDGADWCGHQRGSGSSGTYGYECTCDNIHFKKMCLNCLFYNENYNMCDNEKVIEQYKEEIQKKDSPFELNIISVLIKKPTNSCKCWELKKEFINKLFK